MIRKRLAACILKLLGWRAVNTIPPHIKKAIAIGAPHTSYWDAVYWVLLRYIVDWPTKAIVKKQAFFFPIGLLWQCMGAIAVDRAHIRKKTKLILMLMDIFKKSEKLFLAIMPEGARSYAPRWKTSFYKIAVKLNLPILLIYIDYSQKEVGAGKVIYPTGNLNEDLQTIQTFYIKKIGKHPEKGVK